MIAELFTAAVLAAAGYSLGAAVLAGFRRVTLDGWTRKLLFRGGVGLGVLAYLTFALGLLGWLRPPVAWGLVTAALLAGLPVTRREHVARRTMARRTAETSVHFQREEQWPHAWPGGGWPSWVGWAAAVVLAGFALVALRNALMPPHAYDDLTYHLAAPRIYARTGRVAILPWSHHTAFPFTLEMLSTLCLLLRGGGGLLGAPAAQVVHVAVGALAQLALYQLARDLAGPRAGWLAVLVWTATPVVFVQFGTCYTELGCGLYQLLAWLALIEYLNLRATTVSYSASGPRPKARQPQWLPLLAIGAGLCVGVKLTGVLSVAFLVGAVIALGARDRLGLKAVRADALMVACLAALVAAPWIARTWLATGNPVFPFAHGLFASPLWSDDRAAAYDRSQKDFGQRFAVQPNGLLALLDADPDAHRRAAAAPGILWRLTMHPEWFYDRGNAFDGKARLGPAYLALLPVAAVLWLGLVLRRRREPAAPAYLEERDETVAMVHKAEFGRAVPVPTTRSVTERVSIDPIRPIGLLLGHLVAMLGLWFATMQYSRYLVPHLALWAILVAWAAEGLLRLRPAAVASGLIVAMQLVGGWAFAAPRPASGGYPALAAMRAINLHAPPEARVALYGEPRGYWLERDYVWAERGHSTMIPDSARATPEAYVAFLARELGVTHLLVAPGFPLDRLAGIDDAALVARAIAAGRLTPVPWAEGVYALR